MWGKEWGIVLFSHNFILREVIRIQGTCTYPLSDSLFIYVPPSLLYPLSSLFVLLHTKKLIFSQTIWKWTRNTLYDPIIEIFSYKTTVVHYQKSRSLTLIQYCHLTHSSVQILSVTRPCPLYPLPLSRAPPRICIVLSSPCFCSVLLAPDLYKEPKTVFCGRFVSGSVWPVSGCGVCRNTRERLLCLSQSIHWGLSSLGKINFGYWGEMVFAKSLHCRVTILRFITSKSFMGRYFESIKYPIFNQNFTILSRYCCFSSGHTPSVFISCHAPTLIIFSSSFIYLFTSILAYKFLLYSMNYHYCYLFWF